MRVVANRWCASPNRSMHHKISIALLMSLPLAAQASTRFMSLGSTGGFQQVLAIELQDDLPARSDVSPDALHVAVGTTTGFVNIYSIPQGSLTGRFELPDFGHANNNSGKISHLQWASDGQSISAANLGGALGNYTIPTGSLSITDLGHACLRGARAQENFWFGDFSGGLYRHNFTTGAPTTVRQPDGAVFTQSFSVNPSESHLFISFLHRELPSTPLTVLGAESTIWSADGTHSHRVATPPDIVHSVWVGNEVLVSAYEDERLHVYDIGGAATRSLPNGGGNAYCAPAGSAQSGIVVFARGRLRAVDPLVGIEFASACPQGSFLYDSCSVTPSAAGTISYCTSYSTTTVHPLLIVARTLNYSPTLTPTAVPYNQRVVGSLMGQPISASTLLVGAHDSACDDMAVSPDGMTAVIVDEGGRVVLWFDTSTSAGDSMLGGDLPIHTLTGDHATGKRVAFSPSGSFFLVRSSDGTTMWHVSYPALEVTPWQPSSGVRDFCVPSESEVLLVDVRGNIVVCEPTTGFVSLALWDPQPGDAKAALVSATPSTAVFFPRFCKHDDPVNLRGHVFDRVGGTWQPGIPLAIDVGGLEELVALDNRAYFVVDGTHGMRFTVDSSVIAFEDSPSEDLDLFLGLESFSRVSALGSLHFVAASPAGVAAIDVTTRFTRSTAIEPTAPTFGSVQHVRAGGPFVYVMNRSGLCHRFRH